VELALAVPSWVCDLERFIKDASMRKLIPRSFAASLALFVLLAEPAFADNPQPPQSAPAESAPPAAGSAPPPGSAEEMICKVRSEPAIGTKINKKIKICRTRREWDEEKRIGQGTAERVQKSGGGQSGLLPMGPAGRGDGRSN
jgi:hypothetical protein